MYLLSLHKINNMAYKQTGKRTVNSILNELIERTNSDSRRLRLLEQNNSIHKTRINILEKELLGMKKSYLKALNDFESKLENQNVQIVKIQNYIKEIVKQLKKSATKADIGGLEQLVNIFNPLTSKFVTKKEVMKMIKETK